MEQPTIIIKDPTKADTKEVANMIKSILDAIKEVNKSLKNELASNSQDNKEKLKELK